MMDITENVVATAAKNVLGTMVVQYQGRLDPNTSMEEDEHAGCCEGMGRRRLQSDKDR